MDEKDLVEGMREYISLLQKEGRYSSAKSYQDAMNSFIRYSGTDRIPYTYINKDTLRRYEAYLLEKGCMRNTVSTYIRRLRCIPRRNASAQGPFRADPVSLCQRGHKHFCRRRTDQRN